jgi:putative membrane protein
MNLWHWHPSAVLALGGVLALYRLGLRRAGAGAAPHRGQRLAFAGGLVAVAAAVLGPLAEWAEHAALSAHMAQHLVLTLVVPPLWLIGLSPALLAPLARVRAIHAVGYALTRPVAAFLVGAAALVIWHLPVFFEAALRHEGLHALEHATLLATALLAWWPVLGPLPAWPRLAPPARLLYLFLCTVPMTAVAGPVTLAETVLYRYYESAGAAWPLAPRADQELAGVLMWMGGTVGYLIAGTVIFFRWALAEEPAERGTALASDEVS